MDENENWCRYADWRPNLYHQIKWVSSLVAVPNDLPLPPANIVHNLEDTNQTINQTKGSFTSVQMGHTHTHSLTLSLFSLSLSSLSLSSLSLSRSLPPSLPQYFQLRRDSIHQSSSLCWSRPSARPRNPAGLWLWNIDRQNMFGQPAHLSKNLSPSLSLHLHRHQVSRV